MIKPDKTLSLILECYLGQCQGGAELQAHYLELVAIQQRWRTHYCFISTGGHYENNSESILHPITKKRIWHKLGDIKYPYAGFLLKILKQMKPDVIYQRCGLSLTGIAAFYAKKNNCRFVFHIAHDRDVQPLKIQWKKPYLIPEFMLMQYGIKNADTIIAQTQFQANQLLKNYGKTATVIPNAHPVPPNCKKNTDKIIILWIANWKSLKQPEIFIKLAEKIGNNDKVRLIMLGRNDNYGQLVTQARKNRIKVMGEIPNDEANALLESAHILVNTSKQEGFSNTFIQAWMRRVPVVSLSVDPDGILHRKKIGYCSGSFDKLVLDTQKLIIDQELRETMGTRAREYAIKHFSLENMEKILKIIENLAL
jgi:glycosyltransferase involved in cell wall biosynthesis